jgi:hypothetical protein
MLIAGTKSNIRVLIGILLLASGAYAAVFYATEALSERDYSGIADPQLRVGYCMLSNTSIPEKYLLAESAAHPPNLEVHLVVMPHALRGEITEQKKAAIWALKARDELRQWAIRSSFRVAGICGYWEVAWPPKTTPLDITTKLLQYDSTFSYFLERVRADPDAADRVYDALGGAKARTRGNSF